MVIAVVIVAVQLVVFLNIVLEQPGLSQIVSNPRGVENKANSSLVLTLFLGQ